MLKDTLAKNVITIEHSQTSTLTIVANANVNTHNLALMSTLTITLADSQHLRLPTSHALSVSHSHTLKLSNPQHLTPSDSQGGSGDKQHKHTDHCARHNSWHSHDSNSPPSLSLSLSLSITRITCHTKPHVTFHFHKKQIQHDTQKTACCLLIVLVVSRVNCPLDERNERNQHSLHRAQPEFTKHWQNPNTFFLLFHWVR